MVFGSRLNILPRFIKGKVKRCILIGTLTPELADLFRGWTDVVEAYDLPKAVEIANQLAETGDVVIFSPACQPDKTNPSAGSQRSEIFNKAVKKLPKTPRMLPGRQAFMKI